MDIQPILAGDRRAVAKAITFLESNLSNQRQQINKLCDQLMPHTGKSLRIGISGTPGVGKSTFIEAMGQWILDHHPNYCLGVLAIDPSSPISGGSILGDKTRMQELANHPRAFIRPSPTGGFVGGIARRTKEAMLVLESAGYDLLMIETVGVGQSEVAVSDMVDIFLYLQQPAAGDGLQGIKKGILELADIVVINKADGTLKEAAETAKSQLIHSFHFLDAFFAEKKQVLSCSSLEKKGLAEIWQAVRSLEQKRKKDHSFEEKRQNQFIRWFDQEISYGLFHNFQEKLPQQKIYQKLLQDVGAQRKSPPSAAEILLADFRSKSLN